MRTKLEKIFNLEIEIIGGKIEEIEFTGLLREEITFKTKYNLQKLLKKIQEEKNHYIEIEKELFKSMGAVEKDDSLVVVEFLEDGTRNPMIDKLISERFELMNQDVDPDESGC